MYDTDIQIAPADIEVAKDDVRSLLRQVEGYRDNTDHALSDKLSEVADELQEALTLLDECDDLFTKTYRVTFYRVISLVVEVEAVDEEDALEKAQDAEWVADVEDDNVETIWAEYVMDGYPPEVEEA